MDLLTQKLSKLSEEFPLPGNCSELEFFTDTLTICDHTFYLCGCSVKIDGSISVTGSASSENTLSLAERAYFELLERVCALNAKRHPQSHYDMFDFKLDKISNLKGNELFPESSSPNEWAYSVSNGIAAHTSLHLACENALNELIERDAILNSWYGKTAPRILNAPSKIEEDLSSFKKFFELKFAQFQSTIFPSHHVIGAFLFASDQNLPLIQGYGANKSLEDAINSAKSECLQRLSFLWGEDFSSEEVPFSPTPIFHQELFSRPSSQKALENWLSGGHLKYQQQKPLDRAETSFYFVDLTPPSLSKKLTVVKAFCEQSTPLFFGRNPYFAGKDFPNDLLIHPIT